MSPLDYYILEDEHKENEGTLSSAKLTFQGTLQENKRVFFAEHYIETQFSYSPNTPSLTFIVYSDLP